MLMSYANKGVDQPLISVFVICYLDSIIPLVVITKISRTRASFCSWAGGLSFTCSQISTGFLKIWLKWLGKESKWAPSSEFVSLSIPSWSILTAHAQPFRGARDLAFCLKVSLDSLLVWASSGGSGRGSGSDAQARLNLRCSHRR